MFKVYNIEYISPEDIELTKKIEATPNYTGCGNDIVYLFKKYLDKSFSVCTGCGSDVYPIWKKYLKYYNKYIETTNE